MTKPWRAILTEHCDARCEFPIEKNMVEASTRITPKIFQFSDIDHFRSCIRSLDVVFTPLVTKASAEQKVLTLPSCELVLTTTFPRVVDARTTRTTIAFAMEDETSILFNGLATNKPAIALGEKGALYNAVERGTNTTAMIFFESNLENRGWPRPRDQFRLFETSAAARQHLRMLMLQILSASSGGLDIIGAAGIKESLLAGLDVAFADASPPKWRSGTNSIRQFKLFQEIRAALSEELTEPVYSQELAQRLGVSVRTLQDTVLRFRGMSLHRYLRLSRLWLVRKRLLAGAQSVKVCAFSCGFWHLGDFARSYRAQFGESPSDTLARSRF
jgi:AraC-like DNA-binding protein